MACWKAIVLTSEALPLHRSNENPGKTDRDQLFQNCNEWLTIIQRAFVKKIELSLGKIGEVYGVLAFSVAILCFLAPCP